MKDSRLARVLTFDIWASATTAVAAVAGASWISGWLEISAWVPVVFGLILVPWVWLLARTRREPIQSREVMAVVVLNVAFGVGATALALGFPDALPTSGRWAVAIFGIVTADLGLAEWAAFRRLDSRLQPNPVAS